MRERASSSIRRPKTSTVPTSGPRMSSIIRMVVVFPAPFGPSRPYMDPRGTIRSRSRTATVSPNCLPTSDIRTVGGLSLGGTLSP